MLTLAFFDVDINQSFIEIWVILSAWFASNAQGQLSAFLNRDAAGAWAKAQGGRLLSYADAKASASVAVR